MPVIPPTHQFATTPDPLAHIEHEWLLTNGSGAYAMGTVPGANTRRYHGLLVASARPPVARVVALNQVLEQVVSLRGGKPSVLEFTTCVFNDAAGPGVVYAPKGANWLTGFSRGECITWTYRVGNDDALGGGLELTRELNLHWKQQAATIRYKVRRSGAPGQAAPTSLKLRLAPMVTLRDFHHLVQCNRDGSPEVKQGVDSVMLSRGGSQPEGTLNVTLRVAGSRFAAEPNWWYRIQYPIEQQRGQDCLEDNFVPGWFEVTLDPATGGEAVLTVALGEQPAPPLVQDATPRSAHLAPVLDRMKATVTAANAAAPGVWGDNAALPAILAIASDDFIVDRWVDQKKLATIIAGYPWFADWGRDTFIALPGLLLATGRFEEARSTLRTFAGVIREGLVPNVFDDYNAGAAHYNTVDGSLWFVHAAMEYVHASGDQESWRDWLAAACMSVVEAYIKGVNPPGMDLPPGEPALIRMAGDGLITAGSPQTQLSWMDAKCGDTVFTPRPGKAVEINALWFHVLTGMAELLAPTHKGVADHYAKLTARIGRAFSKVFWDEGLGYLHDHVWIDPQGMEQIDRTCRPNQMLAVSLPNSPLPRKRQQMVLESVKNRLLTPVGLRTLPQGDPHYHAHYAGPPFARDEAYHQGTVWAWLIGPYAEGVLRLGRFSPASRVEAATAIQGLVAELLGPGLGQLHEIFDADAPHRPAGCIAQAWSVAEVIRVMALIGKAKA